MRELVIGAGGFIGAALLRANPEASFTTRETLDLRYVRDVPPCDIAYICAGSNGAWKCEMAAQAAFAANVDGPVEIARQVAARGGFTVVIGSMSVEWTSGTKYQHQKLTAETILRAMPAVGIVRAGRVTQGNVDELCRELIRVGRGRVAGVTRWGTDELSYHGNRKAGSAIPVQCSECFALTGANGLTVHVEGCSVPGLRRGYVLAYPGCPPEWHVKPEDMPGGAR